MGNKKCLNSKRLAKKQVQELIESEGRLHEEFTDFFEETYSTGHKNQPQVYELSNDRFLFVFDPKGILIPGGGDIYPREYFLRMMRWTQKVREVLVKETGCYVEWHPVNSVRLIAQRESDLVSIM